MVVCFLSCVSLSHVVQISRIIAENGPHLKQAPNWAEIRSLVLLL